jgi:dihydrodipicolinate synthase/N-acetylneuraminate lyase
MSSFWHGVLPAITTPFDERLAVDHALVAEHCERMAAAGCLGVIPAGSLGEGATLSADEKLELVRTCAETMGDGGAVVPGIASLSTADAVSLATRAAALGAAGLMVLPPYAYSTDWREMRAHVRAVIGATDLPCILYNNPVAYGTDFLPEQIAELADELPNLEAVKESSTDVRRVTELKRLLDDRLAILVGVDDLIVEGVGAGADGWVAGLVNAFPEESVRLFELARGGESSSARRLYEWFLPLLRLDTVPKLVQLIKLAQELTGQGPARVRPPRLDLTPEERADATAIVEAALASRTAA